MRRRLIACLLVIALFAIAAVPVHAMTMHDCMAWAWYRARGATMVELGCNGWLSELDGNQYHVRPITELAYAGWAAVEALPSGRARIVGFLGEAPSPCGAVVQVIYACKVFPDP
jgi:hypothetical protein